jgi:hypothetical protein
MRAIRPVNPGRCVAAPPAAVPCACPAFLEIERSIAFLLAADWLMKQGYARPFGASSLYGGISAMHFGGRKTWDTTTTVVDGIPPACGQTLLGSTSPTS